MYAAHLSLAKTTLSLNESHDLEITEVDLQVFQVVLGHLFFRTPSTSVRLTPNSTQNNNRSITIKNDNIITEIKHFVAQNVLTKIRYLL